MQEKLYPTALCIGQLILVRMAIAWNDGVIRLLSYTDMKWHLMALSLFVTCIAGVRSMFKLDQKHTIDVNQTAKIVQSVIKVTLGSIIALNSILVLVYKIRADNGSDVPEVYQSFLNWELVLPLDQIQLGKLIYNYEGAGLFVLCGLFYVLQRASHMTMGESSNIGNTFDRYI